MILKLKMEKSIKDLQKPLRIGQHDASDWVMGGLYNIFLGGKSW